MVKVCRVCSKSLESRPGRGRPGEYCSQGCRRAREFEIRRADRAIERAETQLAWWRKSIDTGWNAYPGSVKQRDWWANEVERLTAELAGLLADDEGGTTDE